jgi:hypothetical protein
MAKSKKRVILLNTERIIGRYSLKVKAHTLNFCI